MHIVALGWGDRIQILRSFILRIEALERRYRELELDSGADREVRESARVLWKAYERDLGGRHKEIAAVIDYFLDAAREGDAAAKLEPRRAGSLEKKRAAVGGSR
jgi:hypothetical protein